MPFAPRRLPPTIGIPPEFAPRPVEKHAPIPKKTGEQSPRSPGLLSLSPPTLSVYAYKPDMALVLRIVTGKEHTRDPYTGQLVPASIDQRNNSAVRTDGAR